jgi:hypothetical protein
MKIFSRFAVFFMVSFLFAHCRKDPGVEFRTQNELWLLNETEHLIKVLSFSRNSYNNDIHAGVRYVTNGYRFYSTTVQGDVEDHCIPSWSSYESWQTNHWLDSLVITMVTDTAELPLLHEPLSCMPYEFDSSQVSFYDTQRALRINTYHWALKEEHFK